MTNLNKNEDCFYLGCIRKSHGTKGEVSIFLAVDNPQDYKKLGSVFVEIKQQLIPFFIKSINLTNKSLAIVKFEDVDSMDAAAALAGSELYLPLEVLPEKKGNQFYFHEIIDYKVIDKNHGDIGYVAKILEYPTQALIQVMKGKQEILIPIVDEFFVKVDKANKTLHLNTPAGLIDLYLSV